MVILLPTAESDSIPDYLEYNEIEKLLNACQTPMETALVTILCDTGLRISELLVITSDDVDWGGGWIFAHREKTKKEGWIPISRQSLDALEKYLSWRHTKDKRLFHQNLEELEAVYAQLEDMLNPVELRKALLARQCKHCPLA